MCNTSLVFSQAADVMRTSQEIMMNIEDGFKSRMIENEAETIESEALKMRIEKSASLSNATIDLGGARISLPDTVGSDCMAFSVCINRNSI